MSNKGVSGIIATILLVMIAIALVGVAYVFFSGMVGGKTAKVISILEAQCTGTTLNIVAVISNDGTTSIATATDIKVFVDGVAETAASITFNPSGVIAPHSSTTITGIDKNGATLTAGTTYSLLIVGPSNSEQRNVIC